MSEKHQECSECGKPLAHRVHSPAHGTHAYREPGVSPQATEMQTRILDAAYAQQKRMERAAQPAAGTTPQAERPDERCGNCDHHTELHNIHGCTVRIQREDGNRYRWMVDCPCKWNTSQAGDGAARAVAPVETRQTAEQFLKQWMVHEEIERADYITQASWLRFAEAFRDKSEAELQEEIERLKRELLDAKSDAFDTDVELTELRAKLAEQEALDKRLDELKAILNQYPAGQGGLCAVAEELFRIAKRFHAEQYFTMQRVEAAEAELAALRERERWIPVEERLPVFRIPVQVSGGVAELRIDGWWTYMESPKRRIEWKVTHWKALSAAPEVKS